MFNVYVVAAWPAFCVCVQGAM